MVETPFQAILNAHAAALQGMAESEPLVIQAAKLMADSIRAGKSVLTCGNGGSAADAQHIAAELVGRFLKERSGWPAIDLVANAPVITSIGNDYSYERVFARQVEAHAPHAGCFIGISTSGNSGNVVTAAKLAKELGIPVIGMTGQKGGLLAEVADVCLRAPSDATPRIQEMHLIFLHALCEFVETDLAGM